MEVGLLTEGVRIQKFDFGDPLNERLADFDLICRNGQIRVHKILLLSRCLYYRRQYQELGVPTHMFIHNGDVEVMKLVVQVIYGEVVQVPLESCLAFFQHVTKARLPVWMRFEQVEPLLPPDEGIGSLRRPLAFPTPDNPNRPTYKHRPRPSDVAPMLVHEPAPLLPRGIMPLDGASSSSGSAPAPSASESLVSIATSSQGSLEDIPELSRHSGDGASPNEEQ